jgi:hypothetical protein
MTNHQPPSNGRVYGDGPRPERPWQLRVGFWLLLVIAAFYLLTEHRAHLALGLPYLPFLVLAACPLIHLFGHGGHGGHRSHSLPRSTASSSSKGVSTNPGESDTRHRHTGDLP